eukprot:CAMPEP_0185252622 /NCGR_PEP_ID=MMETSP1359-20130426/1657_1 /TAXON_ID=552665 /ORGANISM="Bigelowiella longifila, Strain CCMP242" /LENGTH=306 /DNA_ID=CAMNT_0027834843 /DNA_START=35 /DNA_END=955 /DNA_ORIENTATION=-
MQAPRPIYKLLPRMSYLPLVTTSVRDHFVNYAPAIRGDLWFDFDGKPLKWHYPIGVLFDLVHNCGDKNSSATKLPLEITVHFTGYPSELLPCRTLTTVNEHFFHSLKEGCYLKYGTSSIIMNMQKSLHLKMEQSLVTGDYRLYEEASRGWAVSESKCQKIPIRIMIGDGFDANTIKNRLIQPSLEMKDLEGKPFTLRSALKNIFPSLDLTFVRAVIQGIKVPTETSLFYLAENMCHADQFLYICLSLHKTPQNPSEDAHSKIEQRGSQHTATEEEIDVVGREGSNQKIKAKTSTEDGADSKLESST